MRLFYAVEIPEPLRQEIRRVQSLLRPARANVRWVDPEIAHLTVKFVGDVEADQVVPLDRAVAPAVAAARPVRLEIAGLGAFPRADDAPPKVLWVGLRGEADRLIELNAAIEEALVAVGFPGPKRPYHPHVTLGRVRGHRGAQRLRRQIQEHRDVELGEMMADEVVLLESERKPDGPRYHRLASYPIGG